MDSTDPVMMQAACEFWWDQYIEISDQQERRDFTLSDEMQDFLGVTEALAKAAEANGLDSTTVVAFLHEVRSFYFHIKDRLPVAGPPVQYSSTASSSSLRASHPLPCLPRHPLRLCRPPFNHPLHYPLQLPLCRLLRSC